MYVRDLKNCVEALFLKDKVLSDVSMLLLKEKKSPVLVTFQNEGRSLPPPTEWAKSYWAIIWEEGGLSSVQVSESSSTETYSEIWMRGYGHEEPDLLKSFLKLQHLAGCGGRYL